MFSPDNAAISLWMGIESEKRIPGIENILLSFFQPALTLDSYYKFSGPPGPHFWLCAFHTTAALRSAQMRIDIMLQISMNEF